ncbi:MAG: SufD family Fe-S cluster assembly protein [Proteobacteria bacterium]|nr:SufD family Fe-S cluster assembly protein [Pseudomonadota bacterium]
MTRATIQGVSEIGDQLGNPAVIPDRRLSFAQDVADSLSRPTTREVWKYTSLNKLLAGLTRAPVATTAASPVAASSSGVVVTRFRAAHEHAGYIRERFASVDPERYPLADLGAHLSSDGVLIDVMASVDATVRLDWSSAPSTPVVIRVAPDARLNLIEISASETGGARFCDLAIGRNAQVNHSRTDLVEGGTCWHFHRITQQRDSSYTMYTHTRGGDLRRHECQVLLEGSGAHCSLTGGWWLRGRERLDQQMTIEHRASHTQSLQKFHAIGDDRSKSTFNGRIHIHAGIADVDAHLVNRNLVHSEQAEMNTKPELEIYSDDVRCSHGATVGQISQDSIFYLTSRGISRSAALALLRSAFLREVVDGEQSDLVLASFGQTQP